MTNVYLTPSEDLAIDVLMARYRTGESLWTFEARHKKTMKSLEAKGLVWWKSGIVENTILAGLTDKGFKEFLANSKYVSPLERKLKEA